MRLYTDFLRCESPYIPRSFVLVFASHFFSLVFHFRFPRITPSSAHTFPIPTFNHSFFTPLIFFHSQFPLSSLFCIIFDFHLPPSYTTYHPPSLSDFLVSLFICQINFCLTPSLLQCFSFVTFHLCHSSSFSFLLCPCPLPLSFYATILLCLFPSMPLFFFALNCLFVHFLLCVSPLVPPPSPPILPHSSHILVPTPFHSKSGYYSLSFWSQCGCLRSRERRRHFDVARIRARGQEAKMTNALEKHQQCEKLQQRHPRTFSISTFF